MGNDALDARRLGDAFYTGLSIGIAPDQTLVGDMILKPLPQPISTVKVVAHGTEAWRMIDDSVGDFSMPERVDISKSTIILTVDGHALENPISYRQAQESIKGPAKVDLEAAALYTLKQRMLLRREKLQADLLTAQTSYTATTHYLDQNGKEWDRDNIDPMAVLVPVIEDTIPVDAGVRPNALLFSGQVWAKFIQNPNVRNRVFGSVNPQGVVTKQQIASLLNIDQVLVGYAVSRTAAGVATRLWGKNAVLAYVPPVAGVQIPSFGYTVEQTVFGNASESVVRIEDMHMGASGGYFFKRSAFYTPAITFKDSGALFANAIQ